MKRRHFQRKDPQSKARHRAVACASHAQWMMAKERGELRHGRAMARGGPHEEKSKDEKKKWDEE